MKVPLSIQRLIESFEKLPGIGPRTAARLTFYLLHVPQVELDSFADAVENLKRQTVTCSVCFNVGETDPCSICQDPERDKSIICVVEQPLDVLALEKAGKFNGVYHVLGGAINPLQNIGPDELYISQLINRADGVVSEVILATNPTMEGEATAMYITKQIKNQSANQQIKITRIARGLPVGGDLEYADEITLQRAIEGRSEY